MAVSSAPMVLYLTGGWYTHTGQRRLRNEVVDGAIDTSASLFQAGVPPNVTAALALKIRALASYADPPHRRRPGKSSPIAGFSDAERQSMRRRLQSDTDTMPALQCFMNDCFEHIHDAMDLRALYLHLVHITQMMQILKVARLSGAAAGLLDHNSGAAPAAAPQVAATWVAPPIDIENDPKSPATPVTEPVKAAEVKQPSPRKPRRP